MKTVEVKHLLQRYFEGETTPGEERELEAYFKSGNVSDELKQYSGFFTGLSELAEVEGESTIEDDVMDFIGEQTPVVKINRSRLWQTVSGIAASVVIIAGSYFMFQKQEEHLADTFDNPETAYAYAEQTLSYMSAKYNQGLAAFATFEKLNGAAEPLQKGVKPINEYLEVVEKINRSTNLNQ